jgi:hypothetical protein
LSIILVLGWLEISGTGHDGIYPKGAALQYGRACELLVRVFPRNLPDRQYASWQRDLLVPTVRLPGSRTPLFVSTEAAPLMSSVRRIPSALEEVRLLPRSTLAFYLESALPLLGTDPADIVPTIRHIRRVLSRGKKQIQALTTE